MTNRDRFQMTRDEGILVCEWFRSEKGIAHSGPAYLNDQYHDDAYFEIPGKRGICLCAVCAALPRFRGSHMKALPR